MQSLYLQADGFTGKVLDNIINTQNIALMFAVVAVIVLYRMYNSEKKYNRERDEKVIEIVAIMTNVKTRLDDSKNQGEQLLNINNKLDNIARLVADLKQVMERK